MTRILLLEDDLSLIDGLEFALAKNGFDVTVARSVASAIVLLKSAGYDLYIIDLALPDGSGFEVCKEVRALTDAPILFLTASDEELNIVKGLDMGGDDYLTKPFRLNELISRINALLRRAGLSSEAKNELRSGCITVKLSERQVQKNGSELDLTAAEYRLLCLFVQNPGVVLTRAAILDRLWDGSGSFVDDNTLSVYVRRLRSKIEDDPENPAYLLTARGVGYKWNGSR